jgi:hypothetical protein
MARQISQAQLAGLLRQEGVKEDLIPTMVAISQAESGLDPRALNPDRSTGDYSFGLYQINMIDEPGYMLGAERRKNLGLRANEELYDPKTNVRAAKAILDSQGLGAWSVYKSGAYKQYLPGAQQAAGVSSSMPQPTAPPPVDGKSTDKPTVKNNAEFLKSYIGGGLGATRALAPPAAPKSINVLGLLQSAFKAPKLME